MAEKNSKSWIPDATEIKFLRSRRKNLRELLQSYQSNLDKLRIQEAKYGISAPLSLINEIDWQQTQLAETQEELTEVDNQITELVARKIYTPLHIGGRNRGVLVTCWNKKYRLPEYSDDTGKLLADIHSDFYGEECSPLTWGYSGTGPHYTAYSILRDLVGQEQAQKYHFSFVRAKIQHLPSDKKWILRSDEILAWLETAPTNEGTLEQVKAEQEEKHKAYWRKWSEVYKSVGCPYGDTKEGLNRWHKEQWDEEYKRRKAGGPAINPLDLF
jgi:hypothetical protein